MRRRRPGPEALTFPELFALPSVVSVPVAGRALGMGANKAYRLARGGSFPCPVIRHGHRYRVPTAAIIRVLEIGADAVDLRDVRRGAAFAARLDR